MALVLAFSLPAKFCPLDVDEENNQTKGNNSARQTRDTTTKTRITYGSFTWHAREYKIHKLHQRYILCTCGVK